MSTEPRRRLPRRSSDSVTKCAERAEDRASLQIDFESNVRFEYRQFSRSGGLMKHASLFALALALVACGDDDRPIGPWIDAGPRADGGFPFRDSGLDGGEIPDSGTDAGGPPRGRVRFASLSRALGPVDVYSPESPIALARGVAYRGASGYAPLEAGEHELLLRRTGDAPTAEPIATIELTIDEGSERLVALGGTADELVTWIVDDVEVEPPLGFASATVIHAMDGLGVAAADLDADRALDLEDLAPAGRADGISVPATGFGSAVVAGDARTELSFTWSSGIEEGSTIVLALVGEVGGTGVDAPGLLAILPEAAGSTGTSFLGVDPEVAILQASPNVLDAEVQVGEIAFGTLAYGELVAPRRVPPGNAYVNVVGRDAEGELVFAGNTAGDLVRGERYLVVLGGPAGFRDVRRFQVVATRLALEPAGADARAHVVHVSEDAPEPLALFVDDTERDVAVRYGSRTPIAGITMPTGERTLGFGTPETVPSWRFVADVPSARVAWVVAGRYFATDVAEASALSLFAIDLDAWTVTRVGGEAGSGPREGEEPPSPPDDPGGGIGI